MNNKGFTLIELLAVLVILSIIITIAIPSITSAVERNKQKVKDAKIKIIISHAENYASTYKNILKNDTSGNICINVKDLIDKGLLDDNDIKDMDENMLNGKITYKNNIYTYSKGACTYE